MWIPLISALVGASAGGVAVANTDTSSPYGSKRGAWVPLLHGVWRPLTLAVLPGLAIVVGLDYILGTPTHPARMRVIEDAPSRGVGSLLMTAGLIVVAGYVARWRMTVIVGLVTQAALMATPWGGDGCTAAVLYLGVAAAAQAAATGYALQPSYERADGPQWSTCGHPTTAVAAHLPPRGPGRVRRARVLGRREAARCLRCARPVVAFT